MAIILNTEDIFNALTALGQQSRRFSELAERYSMDPAGARLAHRIYSGALADVGAVFGLALPEPVDATWSVSGRPAAPEIPEAEQALPPGGRWER